MAGRASLLQATWNYERQQGIGWAWALGPALDRFYPDRAPRLERLAEHTAFFNTQPTLASLALGAAAALEEQRAVTGAPDAEGMTRIKNAMGSSLAAIGDRMFWFTLRPLSALIGALIATASPLLGALALLLCYNAVHQTLRVLGISWGYDLGPSVLGPELRRGLERFIRFGSLLGVAACGALVAALLVPGGSPSTLQFQLLLAAGLVLALVATGRVRPSPTEWALGVTVLSCAGAWLS
jgi:mannose/fructose/N-acetylgalactosamine-specific phosphotransferase system component IID